MEWIITFFFGLSAYVLGVCVGRSAGRRDWEEISIDRGRLQVKEELLDIIWEHMDDGDYMSANMVMGALNEVYANEQEDAEPKEDWTPHGDGD